MYSADTPHSPPQGNARRHPPRVLQVNMHDVGGGAATVMQGLHTEYLRRGIDAWIAVGHKSAEDERTLLIDNDAARSAWTRSLERLSRAVEGGARDVAGLRRALARTLLVLGDPPRYRDILTGMEDVRFPATKRLLDLPPSPVDILHLHNLHGYYFDLRELPRLTARVPAVLTMHDAWLLTGHCAHPFDCERWREGCGRCPDLGIYVPIRRDASERNAAFKREMLRRSDVRLSSPSRWLLRMAEETGVIGEHTEGRLIPNGVDVGVYAPGDKRAAREQLGLPLDRQIVLIVAHLMDENPFKDYRTLRQALPMMATSAGSPPPLVVALGSEDEETLDGADILPVSYVAEAEKVATYYRAADVYVHAARAENQPLAILEAMACGTPVVASNVGGVPEIVADGNTGILVPPGDPGDLAAAVRRLLGDEERREAYGRAGIRAVHAAHTLERQADAYVSWFQEILAPRR